MRPSRWWALGVSLLSFCHLGIQPARLDAQVTGADLWSIDALPLESEASVPPEDPRASTCRYRGFQAEWLASKRDAGLALETVARAVQRLFARDHPWDAAVAAALGPLVYRHPQRSPAELRQVLEAACLASPGLWTDPDAVWTLGESP